MREQGRGVRKKFAAGKDLRGVFEMAPGSKDDGGCREGLRRLLEEKEDSGEFPQVDKLSYRCDTNNRRSYFAAVKQSLAVGGVSEAACAHRGQMRGNRGSRE